MTGGNASATRALHHLRIGVVADYDARFSIKAAAVAGVDDRLRIAATMGGKYAEPQLHPLARLSSVGRASLPVKCLTCWRLRQWYCRCSNVPILPCSSGSYANREVGRGEPALQGISAMQLVVWVGEDGAD